MTSLNVTKYVTKRHKTQLLFLFVTNQNKGIINMEKNAKKNRKIIL